MKREHRILLDYALQRFRLETEDGEFNLMDKFLVICLDSFEVYFMDSPSIHPLVFNYYIGSDTDAGAEELMDFYIEIELKYEKMMKRIECEHRYSEIINGNCYATYSESSKCVLCGYDRGEQ